MGSLCPLPGCAQWSALRNPSTVQKCPARPAASGADPVILLIAAVIAASAGPGTSAGVLVLATGGAIGYVLTTIGVIAKGVQVGTRSNHR